MYDITMKILLSVLLLEHASCWIVTINFSSNYLFPDEFSEELYFYLCFLRNDMLLIPSEFLIYVCIIDLYAHVKIYIEMIYMPSFVFK